MTNKERKKTAFWITAHIKYVDYEMAMEIIKAGERISEHTWNGRPGQRGWRDIYGDVYAIYVKIVETLHEDSALVERLNTNNTVVKYSVLKEVLGVDNYLLAERTGIPMHHFAEAALAMAMDNYDHYVTKEELITDIS